ncbi:hypothetical protein N8I77_009583 [Diaporthe amygdali]|uniref:Uncharacterized protein n=1 Tax=Phomopsis amygdali TaxID=1214568 RepID=A0AAD9S9U5_PHOAM|nr:hypothetical protein N8I77_009583 [Diaporthe amygdali]
MVEENLNDLGPFWEEAVKAYERESEHPLKLDSEEEQLHNAEDLLRLIEKRGGDFTSFRERHNKLWSRLQRFVNPIATTGKLVSTILGSYNPLGAPASIVLTSVLHLASSCQGVTQAYDWIESILSDGELGEFSVRLQIYGENPINNALKRKIVAILAFILRIIGRSELLIKRNRFREYLRVSFIGKDEKTRALVEDLNKLLTNEQRLVVALTYEKVTDAARLAAETKETVEEFKDDFKQLSTAVQESTKLQADARLIENLQHTLKTTAVDSTDDWYSWFRRKLLQGSGSWLQNEGFFAYWMQHRAPILWIFGGPGSGKTMLSTWLISLLHEQFESKSETYSGTSIGYFFIKENVEDLRNPNTIFKTMAWQIQQTDAMFRNHAARSCEFDHKVVRAEDTWENLFLDYYQGSLSDDRRAILVLDGLDEASIDAQRRILRLMKDYVSRVRSGMPHRIQFAVFGRSTLRSELKRVKLDREEKIIEVSPSKNHQDMSNYITNRVKELDIVKAMRRKTPGGPEKARKFARGIRRKVLNGAGGVFLWAQLLLDQMEAKDESQINKILASPPLNLYDMIYSVFDRLSRDPEIDVEVANRLLAWVAFARRPLSFGELDVILRLGSTQTNWFLWNHVRGKFASMFRLRYPSNWSAEQVDGDDDNGSASSDAGQEQSTSTEDENDDNFSLGDSSDEDIVDETEVANDGNSDGGGNEEARPHSEDHKVSDADQLYTWAQKHTVVDFSHQRFRDFLVLEGNPEKRLKEPLPIGIDIHSVDLQLVMEGFKVLHAALDNEMFVENYVAYPAFHIFSHLAAVDETRLDDVAKAHILEELYWLMYEERGCRTLFAALAGRDNGECDAFWKLWLANKRTTSLLQRWFAMADSLQGISPIKRSWMRDVSASKSKLLEPLAMTAAKIWLTKKGWGDAAYLDKSEFQVWFLKGYRSLDEQDNISEQLSNWIWARDSQFGSISADEIEGLAEWAQLPKTTHWYTGLGWILWEASETARAQNVLAQAIELDPDAWVAMEAMARSIGSEGQYESAIAWMERALEVFYKTNDIPGIDAFLIAHIAGWKQNLGDHAGASESAKMAWEKNRSSLPAVNSYMQSLIQAEDWKGVVCLLEYYVDSDDGYGATQLAKYFSEYNEPCWWQMGRACRAQSQPGFILDAMNQALQRVRQSGDESSLVEKLLCFGEFRHRFYDQDDEPIRMWEEALSHLSNASTALRRRWADEKMIYTNITAQVHFDIAVQNYKANAETNEAMTKLKQLASTTSMNPDGDGDIFSLYTPGFPSLLYGRWLRDYEKAAPAVWRKCFRARILEQMNGLSDDDPANDTAACQQLAVSLFQAGDRKNAGLILAVLFGTLEKYMAEKSQETNAESHLVEKEDSKHAAKETDAATPQTEMPDSDESPTDGNEKPLVGPHNCVVKRCNTLERKGQASSLALQLESDAWNYTCDGCGLDAEDAGTMFFCEVCYCVNFCAPCLDKVRTSSLEERRCNPGHAWFQAWPIQVDIDYITSDSLGGRPVLTSEWLDTLRKEWLNE